MSLSQGMTPMAKLKAVFLVGTLKGSPEISNTHALSEFLAKHLETYDTEIEIIRLADYNIKPGVYTKVQNHIIIFTMKFYK